MVPFKMMESNKVLKQAANIPCQKKGGQLCRRRVVLHHPILLSYINPKARHGTVPRRGFLAGTLPAQQPEHWAVIHMRSQLLVGRFKILHDHSWHPCPSAGVCIEGFGWWCLIHWTCSFNGSLKQQGLRRQVSACRRLGLFPHA